MRIGLAGVQLSLARVQVALHVAQIGQDVGLFLSDAIVQQRPVPGTLLPSHPPT